MKQPKRRLVRIRYGFRFIRRPKILKKRVKKAQPTQSTQPGLQTNESPSQNIETPESTLQRITTNTATPLAHFDLTCNPYQQFINNLCMQLPDLPQDAFTRSSIDTTVLDHRNSATIPPKNQPAEGSSPETEEQTDCHQAPDKPEDENTEDGDNDDESATTTFLDKATHTPNNETFLPIDPSASNTPSPISASSKIISPSLQNLSNIPSCMLASKH